MLSARPVLGWRRKHAEQRNDELDGQERHHVVVRLTAAGRAHRAGVHGDGRRGRRIGPGLRGDTPQGVGRIGGIGRDATGLRQMRMRRNLVGGQSHGFHARAFTDDEGVAEVGAHVQRHAALQVGQGEGLLAVAAVGGADQLEQCIVVGDRHDRPVAQRPACWCESCWRTCGSRQCTVATSLPPIDRLPERTAPPRHAARRFDDVTRSCRSCACESRCRYRYVSAA